MRIVSLLPSTTEILFAIGAGDDVVGVTFECDSPAEARTRTIVSTTAMPEGLTPREIDDFVVRAVARGEDLYRLDEGALAGRRDLGPAAQRRTRACRGRQRRVGAARTALVDGIEELASILDEISA